MVEEYKANESLLLPMNVIPEEKSYAPSSHIPKSDVSISISGTSYSNMDSHHDKGDEDELLIKSESSELELLSIGTD